MFIILNDSDKRKAVSQEKIKRLITEDNIIDLVSGRKISLNNGQFTLAPYQIVISKLE